jgi:hypothetical protein
MPKAPSIPNCNGIRATARELIALIWMATSSMARGGEEAIKVVDAWVPATGKVGADAPLLLTARNEADAADALLRVRCLLRICPKGIRLIAAKSSLRCG